MENYAITEIEGKIYECLETSKYALNAFQIYIILGENAAYTTIKRKLENMVLNGWIKKREDRGGKASFLYYLPKKKRNV